jgi:AcrR family transcriptional regulator
MARRDTRELVLQTSLALFNELGEPNVSTNRIADEANISPGNLYYHFRSKQDIVVELFTRFATQLDRVIAIPVSAALRAEDLWFQLHLSFELKGHYRFLFRNPIDISSSTPSLRRAFMGLFRRERKALEDMISSLEQCGAMCISSREKEILLNNLMLAMTYWIPFAEMYEERGLQDGNVQIKSIAGALQMIIPYMAEEARAELTNLAIFYLSHPN